MKQTQVVYETNEIKELIGDIPLSKILTPEKIKSCQTLIDTTRDQFFTDESPGLEKIKKLLFQGMDEITLQAISKEAVNIRSHSRLLGFHMVTSICEQIIKFTESREVTLEKKSAILKKLHEVLHLAFLKKIRDAGTKKEQKILEEICKSAK